MGNMASLVFGTNRQQLTLPSDGQSDDRGRRGRKMTSKARSLMARREDGCVEKNMAERKPNLWYLYIYMHVWHLYYMYTFMCFGKLTGECAWTWGLKSWDGDSTFWGTKIAPISYLFFVWNMIIRFGSPSCNYQPWRASRVQLVSATFFTQDIGCIPDDLEKNFRWFSNKFSTIHYDNLWFTMSIYDSLWSSMIH